MIKIIAFGHFKNNNLKPIFLEYEKRIKRYLKIELMEIKEIPIKKNSKYQYYSIKRGKPFNRYFKKRKYSLPSF